MRVLIVEDDSALGNLLCTELMLDGHDAAMVASGASALLFAEKLRPELMLLDLVGLGEQGLEVLARMGERYRSTSVLVLTGSAETEEGVRCLELGADDVVRKPFSLHELRARVKALARRRRQLDNRMLRFGDLEMDRTERQVRQSGREVVLTATEFLLLESLLRRGRQVCSRSELLQEVWRSSPEVGGRGGTNIVEVYINYLRKKLSRKASEGGYTPLRTMIRTVRGEGYRLERVENPAGAACEAVDWRNLVAQHAPALLAVDDEPAADGWMAHG